MKLSLLTTTYNAAETLARTLRSIEHQAEVPDEVVIVDDGSEDDSVEIAEQFSDSLPMKIVRAGRIGRAASLNRGVSESAGEIVAILDADDVAFPWRTTVQREAFQRDEQLGIHGSSYLVVKCSEHQPEVSLRTPPSQDEQIRRALAFSGPFCHSSVAYRKAALEEVGLFDESLTTQIDQDAWVRIAGAGWKLENDRRPHAVHLKSSETYFAKLNTRYHRARTMYSRNLAAVKSLDLGMTGHAAAAARLALNALPLSVVQGLGSSTSDYEQLVAVGLSSNDLDWAIREYS